MGYKYKYVSFTNHELFPGIARKIQALRKSTLETFVLVVMDALWL